MKILHYTNITPSGACLDGSQLNYTEQGSELLTAIYRKLVGDYPKFFKMDALCRLGFIASELLLQEDTNRFEPREDRAIVLFNRSSSLCDDRNYQSTIADRGENYFPSPAIFVYTLPNIVTGEISIRNKYLGETSFYVLEKLNTTTIEQVVTDAFQDETTTSILGGWLDCEDKEHFEAHLFLIDKEGKDGLIWNEQTINELIK